MTKKDEKDAPEKVLGTGAAGDPQHPDAVRPVNYQYETEVVEAEVPEKVKDDK